MRHLLLSLSLVFSFSVLAQKSFHFTPQLLAESEYTNTNKQNLNMVMDIVGEETEEVKNFKEAMETGGFKLPAVMSNVSSSTISMKTEPATQDQIPVSIEVVDITMTQINGGDIVKPDMTEMKNKVWKGTYSTEKGITLDEITMSNNAEAMLQELLFAMQSKNHWSEGELKKGDSFSHDFPFPIPLPVSGGVEMNITTTYTVTKIKRGKAYLNVTQTFKGDGDMEEAEMGFDMQGRGQGKMIYNIEDQFVESNMLDFEATILFSMMGMEMTMDMELQSEQLTSMVDNG